MGIIVSRAGAQLGAFFHRQSYWAIQLDDEKWLSSLDEYIDIAAGIRRTLDWHDDIVENRDHLRIKEIRLYCPPHLRNPQGCMGRLPVTAPGTAFVANGVRFDSSTGKRKQTFQLIGRLIPEERHLGNCECFIWDNQLKAMSTPYKTTVFNFRPWRTDAPLRGELNYRAMGLQL